MSTLKQEFLRNFILNNNSMKESNIDEKIKILDIKTDFINHKSALILIMLDDYMGYCERFNYEERERIRNEIITRIHTSFSRYLVNETIDMGDKNIIVIVDLPGEFDNGSYPEKIKEIIREAQEDIYKNLRISLSAAVSRFDNLINQKDSLYFELQEAALHRFFTGHRSIICVSEIMEYKSNQYTYPVAKEKCLIDSLMSGKIDDTKEIYREIIDGLKEQQYITTVLTLTHLLYNVGIAIDTIQKNGLVLLVNSTNIVKLLHDGTETLDELNKKLFDIFDEIGTKLQDKKSINRDSVINKILDIINNDYWKQDLSVEYFSNMFDMSAAHMGRLFKNSTLETIGDCINRKRMEAAHQLLLDTGLTVEKIAEKVGFSSSIYFFKCFKKYYGVTPGEYRIKNKLNDLNQEL